MQYRLPVGRGPSEKTCPKCDPHAPQVTSTRGMKGMDQSGCSATLALLIGCQKEGQPVPLSNLVLELRGAADTGTGKGIHRKVMDGVITGGEGSEEGGGIPHSANNGMRHTWESGVSVSLEPSATTCGPQGTE